MAIWLCWWLGSAAGYLTVLLVIWHCCWLSGSAAGYLALLLGIWHFCWLSDTAAGYLSILAVLLAIGYHLHISHQSGSKEISSSSCIWNSQRSLLSGMTKMSALYSRMYEKVMLIKEWMFIISVPLLAIRALFHTCDVMTALYLSSKFRLLTLFSRWTKKLYFFTHFYP